MKNWKIQWVLVALFSLTMCGIVACGDDDDDTNEQKENLNEQNKDEYSARGYPELVENQPIPTKEDLDGIFRNGYRDLSGFVRAQLYLEGLRVNDPTKVHTITPEFSELHGAFGGAYLGISQVNKIINFIPSVQQTDPTFTAEQAKVYLAQAKCLRAFSHYNVAMLWGNVFIVTEPITSNEDKVIILERSSQEEVYQAAYTDIKEAVSNFPASGTGLEDESWFTRDAALMLKAEIELTLGLLTEAQTKLNSISNDVLLELSAPKKGNPDYFDIVTIYTPNHLNLFKQEAQGNQEGLVAAWKALPATQNSTWLAHYGYWAALKRLGKAQEVTGCYDYELLMPFFTEDLVDYIAGTEQNPGY